jgi:hypothetical protein
MTPLRTLILSFVLGIGAWIILANLDQQTLQPLIACAEVSKTQTIGLRENTSQPFYTLQIPLLPTHPEGVAVVQLVAVGRSGWKQYPIPIAKDSLEINVYKPSDLLLLRYGLLSSEEALRAQQIEEAAKQWQWPDWWKAQGWKSPSMTLCKTFSEFK